MPMLTIPCPDFAQVDNPALREYCRFCFTLYWSLLGFHVGPA